MTILTSAKARFRLTLLAAGCAAALAGAAGAQQAPAAGDAIPDLARQAQAHANAGEHDAARAALTQALAASPSPQERFALLRMRGAVSFELQDLDGAIADWRGALDTGAATDREEAALNLNIGQLMLVKGDVDAGAALVEQWLAENPPYEPTLMALAQALASDGQLERALPYAEQARALAQPATDRHLALLAHLYRELDRQEDLEALREEIDPL